MAVSLPLERGDQIVIRKKERKVRLIHPSTTIISSCCAPAALGPEPGSPRLSSEGSSTMLIQLCIRDFAIVEQLELELAGGMTAVTGETGAGKSILVDAIGLLLGDRADSGVIRHGAGRADLSAVFDLSQLPAASAWLNEHDQPARATVTCAG